RVLEVANDVSDHDYGCAFLQERGGFGTKPKLDIIVGVARPATASRLRGCSGDRPHGPEPGGAHTGRIPIPARLPRRARTDGVPEGARRSSWYDSYHGYYHRR